MRRGELLGALIVLALAPGVARAQPNYQLVDLAVGSPYDGGVTLNAINDAGHIAGFGVNASTGEIHAFLYSGGAFTDLGLLGYSASDAIAINASDQLAVDGIGPGSTALFYSAGRARRVGSADGGYTYASAINSHGDMVGRGLNGDGAGVGFSWVGGVFTDLSVVGMVRAASLNDNGEIVGSSGYYWGYGGYLHGSLHGCLYTGGVFTDLGSLTGDPRTNTEALGINASGDIVGYSQAADGSLHAFLYHSAAMQDLGTIEGANATAIAINDHGLVIGNLTNPYGANLGAFVVSNGVMTDFGDLIVGSGSGWSQLVVTGLNNAGEIVGYGAMGGATHGFLAEPIQPTGVAPVPGSVATAIESSRPSPIRGVADIPIRLSPLAATGSARLEVFDASGRRVASLLNERRSAGESLVRWNGRDDTGATLANGVYFARLSTRDGVARRRLVLER